MLFFDPKVPNLGGLCEFWNFCALKIFNVNFGWLEWLRRFKNSGRVTRSYVRSSRPRKLSNLYSYV